MGDQHELFIASCAGLKTDGSKAVLLTMSVQLP